MAAMPSYIGGTSPSNEIEETFAAHEDEAWSVVRELADILEVDLVPVPTEAHFYKIDPEPHFHPSGDVAFDPVGKTVYYGMISPLDSLLLLPHEVVHAAWEGSEYFQSPIDEWEDGMIFFEQAWLKKLCTGDADRETLLKRWDEYGAEGRVHQGEEMGSLEIAKERVEDMGLPSPWEDEDE